MSDSFSTKEPLEQFPTLGAKQSMTARIASSLSELPRHIAASFWAVVAWTEETWDLFFQDPPYRTWAAYNPR